MGIIGVVGVLSPASLGGHPGLLHNALHIGVAAMALWFGTQGTYEGARGFGLVLGGLFVILGAAGLSLGSPGAMMGGAPSDARAWHLVPGVLEFGGSDHIVHLITGVLCLAAYFTSRRPTARIRARERGRETAAR